MFKAILVTAVVALFSLQPLAQHSVASAAAAPIAPASPTASQATLANAIQNVKGAAVYNYMSHDSQYTPMDTAKGPGGRQGDIVTMFVPSEGSVFPEAGTLIYFVPLAGV